MSPRVAPLLEAQARQSARGDARHAEVDKQLADLAALVEERGRRIDALEAEVANLKAALAAHLPDDKRHTGRLVAGVLG